MHFNIFLFEPFIGFLSSLDIFGDVAFGVQLKKKDKGKLFYVFFYSPFFAKIQSMDKSKNKWLKYQSTLYGDFVYHCV